MSTHTILSTGPHACGPPARTTRRSDRDAHARHEPPSVCDASVRPEVPVPQQPAHDAPFQHEALLYAGEQGFIDGVLPFLREAVAAARRRSSR